MSTPAIPLGVTLYDVSCTQTMSITLLAPPYYVLKVSYPVSTKTARITIRVDRIGISYYASNIGWTTKYGPTELSMYIAVKDEYGNVLTSSTGSYRSGSIVTVEIPSGAYSIDIEISNIKVSIDNVELDQIGCESNSFSVLTIDEYDSSGNKIDSFNVTAVTYTLVASVPKTVVTSDTRDFTINLCNTGITGYCLSSEHPAVWYCRNCENVAFHYVFYNISGGEVCYGDVTITAEYTPVKCSIGTNVLGYVSISLKNTCSGEFGIIFIFNALA